jgi:hypothetical protein
MNNIWDTNFPAQQQGETTFRYAIASEPAGDPAILGPATAASFTDPLLAVPVSGQGAAPPATERFATVDHPLVRVVALGASRRGHDLVAYLASVAGSAVETRLAVPGMAAAWAGTSLERDQRPLAVRDGEAVVPVPANGFIGVSIDRVAR